MRLSVLTLVVLFAALSLTGCGGSSTKSAEPEKGSLMRTFKLVDDQGREAGTLVLNPQGGAELRDADGKVIGTFNAQQASQVPAEQKEDKPEDESTDDKEKEQVQQ